MNSNVFPATNKSMLSRWRNRAMVLTFAYWQHVERIARKHKIDLMAARALFHQDKPNPPPANECPTTRIMMVVTDAGLAPTKINEAAARAAYLKQLGLLRIASQALKQRCPEDKSDYSLSDMLYTISYRDRSDLPFLLYAWGRMDQLYMLTEDPIYGPDAKAKLDLHDAVCRTEQQEEDRLDALPPNVYRLHELAQGSFIKVVHHLPSGPLPNRICVIVDGTDVLSLEVIDHDYTQFGLLYQDNKLFCFRNIRSIDLAPGADLNFQTLLEVFTKLHA